MTTRRPRSDSATAAIAASINAAKGLPTVPPHVRLRPNDEPFWLGILRSRARDEWNATDLVVAAQLARCQADIESESALLESEGLLAGGKPNPRGRVVDELYKRELAFMRTLRMGGRVAGDTRDLLRRRQLERQATAIREELLDDGLLAG